MRVLGIIPARGGSKGVPRKNIRLLAGKPLLAYTAQAALEAATLTRVILSTDDEEIAGIGENLGLEVPFLRPRELAEDSTPTLPVIQHAVRVLEDAGHHFDVVCLLQPTNPLRTASDIDGCVRLLADSGADSVITVLPVPEAHNPHWVYFVGNDGSLRLSTGEKEPIPRRQSLPPAFHREGSVYVTRRDVLIDGDSLYGERLLGYPIDPGRTLNIDTPEDFLRAEQFMTDASANVRN